jgi:hypothetical protein
MKSKTLKILLVLFLALSFAGISDAQVVKVSHHEYKKAVRKKTKELKKKGYSAKGVGSIEIYAKNALNMEFAEDKDGEPMYAVIYTSMVDPTYEGAVSACRAAARAAIAGNMETNVAELVKRSLNTEQISAKSANGINQTVIAGKQLIAQKISTEDIYVLYREVKDERDGKTLIEVEYACYFSRKLAMQKAQEYIREEMKKETEELHKDLDKIFKLD